MKILILIATLIFSTRVFGQNDFWNEEPLPSDSITQFKIVKDFSKKNNYGPNVGDIAPNIALHDRFGNKFDLYQELEKGKPILLIGGNFSCPQFRNKVNVINTINKNYSKFLNVYLVYTLEAHPATDTSVFIGRINPGKRNETDDIMLPQPKTYQQRLAHVDDMNQYLLLNVPILIDNPFNSYQHLFGPSPNNAYIIDTSRTIMVKQQNFNHGKNIIYEDIQNIFPEYHNPISYSTGTFKLSKVSDTIIQFSTNSEKTISYLLTNQDSIHSVTIDIKRSIELTDENWFTSLGAIYYYPPSTPTIEIHLKPLEERKFNIYIEGRENCSGAFNLQFVNRNNPSQRFDQHFTIQPSRNKKKKRK